MTTHPYASLAHTHLEPSLDTIFGIVASAHAQSTKARRQWSRFSMSKGSPRLALRSIDEATLLPAFKLRARPLGASMRQSDLDRARRTLKARVSDGAGAGCAGVGATISTGTSAGTPRPRWPSRARRRPPNSRLALTALRRATSVTREPGTKVPQSSGILVVRPPTSALDGTRRTSTRIDLMTFRLAVSPSGRPQTHHPAMRFRRMRTLIRRH